MPNDKKDRRPNDATSPGLSRRNFIAFAAGLTAAATGTASDREHRVIAMDTHVTTPDGVGVANRVRRLALRRHVQQQRFAPLGRCVGCACGSRLESVEVFASSVAG